MDTGPTTAATLLERDGELDRLLGCVASLRGATPCGACALVSGEAGVGKTSLLRCLRERAGDDVQWLWGQCEPMLSPPPLAPLLELLHALPPALAAAVRAGRAGAEVLAGMLALLRERDRPLVLVIDDAQWADGATLDLLAYIARRIEASRALLVIAHRDTDLGADHPLRAVLGHLPRGVTQRLPLAALSRDAVAELARRAGRPVQGLYGATGGNPFFVTELLAAGRGAALPAAVQDAVLARAARLSPAAREVLDLVGMAPNGLETDVLHAVLDASAEAIDECQAAGLLLRDAETLRFRHELARASIEAGCGPQRAAALHSAMFDALGLRDTSAARLVHHAERAGLGAAVLRLAPLAARDAAAVSAHRQAADLLALAVREAGALPAGQRAALLDGYARASAACHRLDEALWGWRHALALQRQVGDALAQARALREMARIAWFQGHIAVGVEQATQAIALLEPLAAERDLAMACGTMAQLHMHDESPHAAAAWGRRALQRFEMAGDAEGMAYALNTVGFAEGLAGSGEGGWALLRKSLAIAREQGFEEHVGRAYANMASLSLVQRRFDLLRGSCSEGIVHCDACDQDMFVALLSVRAAYGLQEQGDWDGATAELARLSMLAVSTPREHEQARHVQALVGLRRGDAAEDAYWNAMLSGQHRLVVDPWYAPQAVACAEAAWLRGDDDAVARIGLAALPSYVRSGECWRVGQIACWLARVGRLPADFDAPVSPPAALALAGDARGAAAAWNALGCRYDEAMALLRGDANDQRDAIEGFDAMGAVAAARAARRLLRDAGVASVGRGPNRHSRDDPQGLTAREREVFELLRGGLSNAAIAARLHRSERTVEHHVAAVLRKLGLASRTGIAEIGPEMGAPEPKSGY